MLDTEYLTYLTLAMFLFTQPTHGVGGFILLTLFVSVKKF